VTVTLSQIGSAIKQTYILIDDLKAYASENPLPAAAMLLVPFASLFYLLFLGGGGGEGKAEDKEEVKEVTTV
jgi:hypothetical protein